MQLHRIHLFDYMDIYVAQHILKFYFFRHNLYLCQMKRTISLLLIVYFWLSATAQQMTAEEYYVSAFNEMSGMLSEKDPLSIKRAVFLAEWAFYEGKLDYQCDFCDEINRIAIFLDKFYKANKLNTYNTGKQMALNEFFFKPYSGNGYKPYTYDFEKNSDNDENWETQFVSILLKTHKGQCRSLPWLYKILAKEIDADVSIAHAPRHCYIMYRDEDNLTPENWINLEVATRQMTPSFWIKKDFEICDSAVMAGTYMTPLTDKQTVACQMSELALGYVNKFKRYDDFTYQCATRSLEFYPMNPNAWIIRGKSLEKILQDHQATNGSIYDEHAGYIAALIDDSMRGLIQTHMTGLEKRPE